MKAFVLAEPGVVCWKEVQSPSLNEHSAILRPVAVTPCTSDIHTIYGNGSRKQKDLVLGHECVALVEQVGAGVKDFKKGDFVAVPAITPTWLHQDIQDYNFNHAGEHFSGHKLGKSISGVFAEEFAVPYADLNLAKIPRNVTVEEALMSVDVITTGFTGVEAADIKFGDSVCVFGVGPIGLAAIIGARLRGAARIIAIGTRKVGIEMARKFGATDIIDYKKVNVSEEVLKLTEQEGVDSVIIAGGNDAVIEQAIDIVKYGTGVVSNVNYFGGTGGLLIPKFSGGRGMAGKTIRMELAKGGRRRIERLLAMIAYKCFSPGELVTHKLYGFDEIEKAIEMMHNKSEDLLKIMVCIDSEFIKEWNRTKDDRKYEES